MSVIQKIEKHNPYDYNITKALEELAELSEVLLKKLNKKGGKKEPSDQEVIDEIGDVQIRVAVLKLIFGPERVDERVKEKLTKLEEYIDNNTYTKV